MGEFAWDNAACGRCQGRGMWVAQLWSALTWRMMWRALIVVLGAILLAYVTAAYFHTAKTEVTAASKQVVCDQAHQLFRKPMVRRIHQMWKDHNVPARWQANQEHCMKLNPTYEYTLWSDADIERFLATHYPWFLPTYHSYPHSIQRSDSSRYFILHHFGGVYLDLDMDCRVPLDDVLNVTSADVILASTDPVGVTNNFMAAKAGHPYFKLLTRGLPSANIRRWSPHLTIMLSAGPLYVYQTYREFPCKSLIHLLSVDEHKAYFHHEQAATWHGWDGPLVTFLDRHQKGLLTLAMLGFIAVSAILLYIVCRRWVLAGHDTARKSELGNYKLLKKSEV